MDRFTKIATGIVVADVLGAPSPNPVSSQADFDRALKEFVEYVNGVIIKHIQDNFQNLTPGYISVMHGPKYAKLVKFDSDGGSRSAYGFVDKRNGDVLMAAGWSAPAKHARANLFKKETWKNAGPYGMSYLR